MVEVERMEAPAQRGAQYENKGQRHVWAQRSVRAVVKNNQRKKGTREQKE